MDNGKGYCCLGLATALTTENLRLTNENRIYGNLPGTQYHAPEWLIKINEDFAYKGRGINLAKLNDTYKLTFPEIAKELMRVYGGEL